jgi:hypothetical protein
VSQVEARCVISEAQFVTLVRECFSSTAPSAGPSEMPGVMPSVPEQQSSSLPTDVPGSSPSADPVHHLVLAQSASLAVARVHLLVTTYRPVRQVCRPVKAQFVTWWCSGVLLKYYRVLVPVETPAV